LSTASARAKSRLRLGDIGVWFFSRTYGHGGDLE
jgi:hypothetical protein